VTARKLTGALINAEGGKNKTATYVANACSHCAPPTSTYPKSKLNSAFTDQTPISLKGYVQENEQMTTALFKT
jgi:hypothetical protein